jgi:hypothetical protein
VVGVVCALTLLLVGFDHVIQDVHRAAPVIASQMDSADSNTSPDAPGKIGIDHCHGCVTVGTPVEGQTTLPIRFKTAYPAVTLGSLHPYSPIAETPPPIFEI